MEDHLSKSLIRYIREIDIIILGIGLLLFVSGDHSPFSTRLFEHKQFLFFNVLLFVSMYAFLTYDWIAFNWLSYNYPYKLVARERSLVRMYIDLFQLFIKSFLIFLATLDITIWHLLLIAILFLIWHPAIALWHFCARREYPGLARLGSHHFYYPFGYVLYAAVTLYFGLRWDWEAGDELRYAWTVVLCVMIVVMSVIRQRRFLPAAVAGADSNPGADAAAAVATAGEADAAAGSGAVEEAENAVLTDDPAVEQRLARLQANMAARMSAREEIANLERLNEEVRVAVEALKQKLAL